MLLKLLWGKTELCRNKFSLPSSLPLKLFYILICKWEKTDLDRKRFTAGQFKSLSANEVFWVFFSLPGEAESSQSTKYTLGCVHSCRTVIPCTLWFSLTLPDVTTVFWCNPRSNILSKGNLPIRLAGKIQHTFQLSWVLFFSADVLDTVSKLCAGVP